MGVWRQIQEYFYIRKRDPDAPNTQWMRYMHGINRISIFMFLIGLIVLIVGGQVHIDLLGAICLFVCGGLVGLVVLWIYNKGRHDGGGPPGPPDSYGGV